MFKEFREFIARGNVIDLAVAVVIGAHSEGSLLARRRRDYAADRLATRQSRLFQLLHRHLRTEPVSLADAQLRGLPVIAYGRFINDIVNFLIIAFVIFLIVKAVNRLKSRTAATA